MTVDPYLTRRSLLTAVGIAAGATVVRAVGLPISAAAAAELPLWSEVATWGTAGVPGLSTVVRLDRPVLLDVDASVAGLQILPGGALHFDPRSSRTLTSTGNLVVEGLLQMRPSAAHVEHALRFTGIDEKRFVGGGMGVLDTDVGLWCTGAGRLDLVGSPRLAWARVAGDVAPGARTITLQADPVGWIVGDTVVITPTGSPANDGHARAYDTATIAGVDGRTVTLSTPTTFAHPAVGVGPGMLLAAEVLNLTRNVRVEGTPTGRTHVMIMTGVPQHLANVSLRHVGPRQADGDHTRGVLGRYGLHLHMMGEASRGSTINGAVVHQAGSHAFVPHASHGIAMTSCIAHDVYDEAFWWDGAPNTRTPGPDTNDLHLESCVASLVQTDPTFRGYRLNGFTLGAGRGGRCTDCVAVGVQGNKDASGFHWPEGPTHGVWDFQGSIAHNNRRHGIFTWQNTKAAHSVRNFVSSHNGGAGVAHGAYKTTYTYENAYLYGNKSAAVILHSNSVSPEDPPQRFLSLWCDSAGLTANAVRLAKHTLAPGQATLFKNCTFKGQTGAAVAAVYDMSNGETTPEILDIVDCLSTTPMLWLHDMSLPGSLVRVQSDGVAVLAEPKTGAGLYRADWNANVRPGVATTPKATHGGVQPFPIHASAVNAESTTRPERTGRLPFRDHGPTAPVGNLRATLVTRGGVHRIRVQRPDLRGCHAEVLVDGTVRTSAYLRRRSTTISLVAAPEDALVLVRCHGLEATWRV